MSDRVPSTAHDPVKWISLPVNRPATGCYAYFQPAGRYDKWPNPEDHIVIARRPGGQFSAVFCTYVPWDEPPLRLWDNVHKVEQCVVYHSYHLAYTLDGGSTFFALSAAARNIIALARFSDTRLLTAQIDGDHLELMTGLVHSSPDISPAMTDPKVWHVPLNSDTPPISVRPQPSLEVQSDILFATTRAEDNDPTALLTTDGQHLWARNTKEEPFAVVPLTPLVQGLQALRASGRVDFFGGAAVRSLIP